MGAAGGGREGLAGRLVLVTSGPTREPIDPVRFISNPATGRMGHALAAAALERGARVVLVTGPTALPPPAGAECVPVTTAEEMAAAVLERAGAADLVVMAAAVGDYRVERPADFKVKKSGDALELRLVPTTDILAELGRRKGGSPRPVLVGFAAETDQVAAHAAEKLARKNLDCIVANAVGVAGSGFGSGTNQVTVLWRDGRREDWPLLTKDEVAARLLDRVAVELFGVRGGQPAREAGR